MIALGIDPGTRNTGLAVVTKLNGKTQVRVSKTVVTAGNDLVSQIGQICEEIVRLDFVYEIDCVVVEDALWYGMPKKGLLALAKVTGAAVAAAQIAGIPHVVLVPAAQRKKSRTPRALTKDAVTEHEKDAIELAVLAWRRTGPKNGGGAGS